MKRKILTKSVITAMAALSVCMPIQDAFASVQGYTGGSYNLNQAQIASSPEISNGILNQGFSELNNNFNQISFNINTQTAGGKLFANTINNIVSLNAPIVMGIYNKEIGIGEIYVDYFSKSFENGQEQININQKILTPGDGQTLSGSFLGQNPFASMQGDHPQFYENTTYNGFVTAMGLWMQHEKAAVGWLATDNTTTTNHTTKSGWFIVTTTFFDNAHTTPVWAELLPVNTNNSTSSEAISLPIPSGADLNNPHTDGIISQGSLLVPAGVSVVNCGTSYCSMPQNTYTSSSLQHSRRGLGILGAILLGGLFAGIIGGFILMNNFGVEHLTINGTQISNSPSGGSYNPSGYVPGLKRQATYNQKVENIANNSAPNVAEANTLAGTVLNEEIENLSNLSASSATSTFAVDGSKTSDQRMHPFSMNPDNSLSGPARFINPWPNVVESMLPSYQPSPAGVSLNPFASDNNPFGQGMNKVTPSTQANQNSQPFMVQPNTYSCQSIGNC